MKESKIRRVSLEEIAEILERAVVLTKMDLGAFCVKILKILCPFTNEESRVMLINGMVGKSALVELG